MGVVFGFGVIFGVRAAGGPILGLLALFALLAATAIATGPTGRNLCLVAGLGCLLGTGAALRVDTGDPPTFTSAPGTTITGEVVSDPDIWQRGMMTRLNWVDNDDIARTSTLFMPPAPMTGRGDRVYVTGVVDGVYGERIFAEHVRVIGNPGRLELRRRAIRSSLTTTIQRYVPGTPGALTLGLLTGDDSALTDAERDDMRRAGLSHLTAVSGWNVTLVTGTVGLLFLHFGLRGWGWTMLQLLALVGFVWIVGPDPPVTRAAIMAVAGLIAIRLGRPAHSATVLVISAALMVVVSPDALTSLAFQLSVLATLGLVIAGHATSHLTGWRAIVLTPLAATAAAGLSTAPLIAAEFGTFSLLTVPANLLAAPLVPAATVAGVVVVIASPIAPLATIAGWGAWLLTTPLLLLARVVASVPYAYHEFAPLSGSVQAILYSGILMVVGCTMPEGRLAMRVASEWIRREPTGAVLTAGAACLALLTATLTV